MLSLSKSYKYVPALGVSMKTQATHIFHHFPTEGNTLLPRVILMPRLAQVWDAGGVELPP